MGPEKYQNIISSEQNASPKKHRLVVASVDIERQARDIAEEKLLLAKSEKEGFGGFFKNLFHKIWKSNLAHEYYRQKEISAAKRKIQETGNLYADEKGETVDHENAMAAIVKRFAVEYEDEILLRQGEEKKILTGAAQENGLKEQITDLVKQFAAGNLDEVQFLTAKKNIFENLPEAKSSVYVDNLLEMAQQIKDSIAHGKGLDSVDADIEIVFGKAKAGVETEAQYNAVDKIAEKIQKSFVGRFVNETTVSSAVAIAYGVIAKGATSAAQRGAKLVGPLGMGLSAGLGGAVAGIRENKRLKEERAQHAREMAKGKKIDDGQKRREEMETFRYETKAATELTANLKQGLEDLQANPNEQKLFAVLSSVNEIESRLTFSQQQNIDLIGFSQSTKVEQERTDLYVAVAEAKVFLGKNIGKHWATFYTSKRELDDYLSHAREVKIEQEFLQEKNLKDQAFNKMKRKQVAGAVTKGLAIGLGVGMLAQEIGAYAGNGKEGLLHGAGASGKQHHYTALEYLRRYVSNDMPHHENVSIVHEMVPGSKMPSQEIFTRETLVGTKDFVKQHEEMFSKIKRDYWADNNTSKPDKNELKLWWGGSNGTGMDKNGNYVFNVKHMTHAGSFHGGKHWDPQNLMKEGKMKLLVSLSGNTQNNVVEIPIDAKGNAIIDPKSEIGRMGFANVDGRAKFLGRFAEVAVMGEQKDGVQHVNILATHLGKGIENLKTMISEKHAEVAAAPLTVSKVIKETVFEDYNVTAPNVIPVRPRNALEKMENFKEQKSVAQSSASEQEELKTELQEVAVPVAIGLAASPDANEPVQVPVAIDQQAIDQSTTPTRAASWHTLHKLEQQSDFLYKMLDNKEQVNERFDGIAKDLWNEFTTHHVMKYNQSTRKFEIAQESDHDGEGFLKLMQLAGFKISRSNINFVRPGETFATGVVGDTSGKNGITVEENGKRLIIDHHADDSDGETSATKFTYELLLEMGLLQKTKELDALVDFITEIDNGVNNVDNPKILQNYERNLYGLYNKISVDKIYELLQNGQDPAELLSDEFLQETKIVNPNDNKQQSLAEYIKFNLSKKIQLAEQNIARLEKDGFVVDTGDDRFGKILIDVKRLNGKGNWVPHISNEAGGSLRVFDKGYGGYILWSPEEATFKVFTKNVMDENSLPGGFGQGRNVRGHMWSKSRYDGDTLEVSLEDILSKLSDKPFVIEGKLEKALEKIEKFNENLRSGNAEKNREQELQNLAVEYLAYKDVPGAATEAELKRIQENGLKDNERKYAQALFEAMQKRGQEKVQLLAERLRVRLKEIVAQFGYLKTSPYSESSSWAYWDIAKQLHMSKHPEDSNKNYRAADPFGSATKQAEIVNRHFGWEIYRNRNELLQNQEFAKVYLGDRIGKEVKKLLEKNANTIGTLSSSDLARLGKLVREKISAAKTLVNRPAPEPNNQNLPTSPQTPDQIKQNKIESAVVKFNDAFSSFELTHKMFKEETQKTGVPVWELAERFIQGNPELLLKFDINMFNNSDEKAKEKMALIVILEAKNTAATAKFKKVDEEMKTLSVEIKDEQQADKKAALGEQFDKLLEQRDKLLEILSDTAQELLPLHFF